jgi:hypothetical protein
MTSNIAPVTASPGNPIKYFPAPVYKEAPAVNPKTKPIKPKAKTKVKAKAKAKPRALRTQRSLFGGDVKNLFPSQRKDLTRRRAARKQAKKTKKTLGV